MSPAPTEQNPPPGTIAGSYTLNSQGYAEDQPIQQPPGTYNFVASYAGDNSYTASTSPTVPITITKAPTTTTITDSASSAVGGLYTNGPITVTVNTQSSGAAPTGLVQVLLNGSTVLQPSGAVTSSQGSATSYAYLQENLSPTLPSGPSTITAQYAGDSDYTGSNSTAVSINITDFSVSVNPTSVNISGPGESGTATLTITPLSGFTGTLNVTCGPYSGPGISCTSFPPSLNVTGPSPVIATLTIRAAGGISATPPLPQRSTPPNFRPRVGWPSLLAALLAALVSLAIARRRPVAWLFATTLLVVGAWAACGGGSPGGGSSGPSVIFDPPSINFGQVNEGSASAGWGTTLRNTGTAPLTISSIGIGGANAGDFAQTTDCLSTLPANSNCVFNLTFTPKATGSRSAALTITDNAGGSPQTVSLTGTGVAPAATINLSPASLAFGQVGASLTSVSQNVTLSNTGTGALSISSITIVNTHTTYPPIPFAQTNNCGSSLAGGANCSISVTFVPPETGLYSGSLLIADNAYASPQTVSLSGTGVTPPGVYSLYVMTAIGSLSHSVPLTVTVQ